MRVWLLLGLFSQLSLAAENSTSYFRDIRPILQRQCQGCHQPNAKSSGLDLTSYAAFQKGGKRGPGFLPGAPGDSLIVKYIKGD
ncbi:MAG TPA: c-type cytochrome domain-containing protein, partial [Bryobacteraceae bacterium]|nr:c-type cytochrome domain-containing protein [Bryobacteraceae bacterium]